jgi:hypothetical protein
MGIYCIIVYLVVQTVDGNVIVPMVAKKTADLAPALVLGAQLIFGVLFGILGLALADPIVAMIKIALETQAGAGQHGQDSTKPNRPDNRTGPLARAFRHATAFMVVLVIAGLFGHAPWAQELSQWPLRRPCLSPLPRPARTCRSRAVDCPGDRPRNPRAGSPARNGPTSSAGRSGGVLRPFHHVSARSLECAARRHRCAAVPTCWSQPRPAPSTMPVRSGCRTTGRPRLAPS